MISARLSELSVLVLEVRTVHCCTSTTRELLATIVATVLVGHRTRFLTETLFATYLHDCTVAKHSSTTTILIRTPTSS